MRRYCVYQVFVKKDNGKERPTTKVLRRNEVADYLGSFNSVSRKTGRTASVRPVLVRLIGQPRGRCDWR